MSNEVMDYQHIIGGQPPAHLSQRHQRIQRLRNVHCFEMLSHSLSFHRQTFLDHLPGLIEGQGIALNCNRVIGVLDL